MKVTYCGEYKGRRYRINAELTKSGKIVTFNAVYYAAAGGSSSVAIVPERPVSTSTSRFNVKGKRFLEQLQDFFESQYQSECSTVH